MPHFQSCIINNYNEEQLVANKTQFRQILKAFDNYYHATGLKDIEDIDVMLRKQIRRKIDQMAEKN